MPWKSNTFNSIDDKHGSDHLLRVNMSTSIMAKLFSKPYLIVSVAMASSDGREGYYYRRILVKLFPTSLRKVSFNFCWKSVAVFQLLLEKCSCFQLLLEKCRCFQLFVEEVSPFSTTVGKVSSTSFSSLIDPLMLLLQHTFIAATAPASIDYPRYSVLFLLQHLLQCPPVLLLHCLLSQPRSRLQQSLQFIQ